MKVGDVVLMTYPRPDFPRGMGFFLFLGNPVPDSPPFSLEAVLHILGWTKAPKCPVCSGTGGVNVAPEGEPEDWHDCDACEGTGVLRDPGAEIERLKGLLGGKEGPDR